MISCTTKALFRVETGLFVFSLIAHQGGFSLPIRFNYPVEESVVSIDRAGTCITYTYTHTCSLDQAFGVAGPDDPRTISSGSSTTRCFAFFSWLISCVIRSTT